MADAVSILKEQLTTSIDCLNVLFIYFDSAPINSHSIIANLKTAHNGLREAGNTFFQLRQRELSQCMLTCSGFLDHSANRISTERQISEPFTASLRQFGCVMLSYNALLISIKAPAIVSTIKALTIISAKLRVLFLPRVHWENTAVPVVMNISGFLVHLEDIVLGLVGIKEGLKNGSNVAVLVQPVLGSLESCRQCVEKLSGDQLLRSLNWAYNTLQCVSYDYDGCNVKRWRTRYFVSGLDCLFAAMDTLTADGNDLTLIGAAANLSFILGEIREDLNKPSDAGAVNSMIAQTSNNPNQIVGGAQISALSASRSAQSVTVSSVKTLPSNAVKSSVSVSICPGNAQRSAVPASISASKSPEKVRNFAAEAQLIAAIQCADSAFGSVGAEDLCGDESLAQALRAAIGQLKKLSFTLQQDSNSTYSCASTTSDQLMQLIAQMDASGISVTASFLRSVVGKISLVIDKQEKSVVCSSSVAKCSGQPLSGEVVPIIEKSKIVIDVGPVSFADAAKRPPSKSPVQTPPPHPIEFDLNAAIHCLDCVREFLQSECGNPFTAIRSLEQAVEHFRAILQILAAKAGPQSNIQTAFSNTVGQLNSGLNVIKHVAVDKPTIIKNLKPKLGQLRTLGEEVKLGIPELTALADNLTFIAVEMIRLCHTTSLPDPDFVKQDDYWLAVISDQIKLISNFVNDYREPLAEIVDSRKCSCYSSFRNIVGSMDRALMRLESCAQRVPEEAAAKIVKSLEQIELWVSSWVETCERGLPSFPTIYKIKSAGNLLTQAGILMADDAELEEVAHSIQTAAGAMRSVHKILDSV